jgi:hypothetical protein
MKIHQLTLPERLHLDLYDAEIVTGEFQIDLSNTKFQIAHFIEKLLALAGRQSYSDNPSECSERFRLNCSVL